MSLHNGTPIPLRNTTGLSNYVSVKELCSQNKENNENTLLSQVKPDDKVYKIPIYDWKKTKFLGVKLQKKLDYISLFPEKQFPNQPEELVKIYEKKKIETPGPETYDMVRNWAKKGHHDYE